MSSYHKKHEVINTKDPSASCSLLSLPPAVGRQTVDIVFEVNILNSHCFALRTNAGEPGGTSVTALGLLLTPTAEKTSLTQRIEKLPVLR